ncbi:30S ribosomal protein S2 [Candidatus Dependentiae bacterium]|nr:30S ribosomal protein S2 [Candidatus Dependentiae bacterium]
MNASKGNAAMGAKSLFLSIFLLIFSSLGAMEKAKTEDKSTKSNMEDSLIPQARTMDPSMSRYIFKRRAEGVHIIDLQKTWEKLVLNAKLLLRVGDPSSVVIVGQKIRPVVDLKEKKRSQSF